MTTGRLPLFPKPPWALGRRQSLLAMADDQVSVPVNLTTTDGQVVPVLLPPAGVAQTLPGMNSSSTHFDGTMVSLDFGALQNEPVGLQEPYAGSEVMPTFGTSGAGPRERSKFLFRFGPPLSLCL